MTNPRSSSARVAPRYLRFTQALALLSGVSTAALWAYSSSSPAPPRGSPTDAGAQVDASQEGSGDDSSGFGGFDVQQGEFTPPSDAPFDAPDVGDGREVRTCRCPGEDANTGDLSEAGLSECASYAEAKYNNCFGIPGPLPPPELPRRRSQKSRESTSRHRPSRATPVRST